MITTSEIRRVALETIDELGLEPYMNCGPVSYEIRDSLQSQLGIKEAYVEEGSVRVGAEYAEHAYVIIPQGIVKEKNGGVIVDGTVKQFDKKHYNNGHSWVCLEDKFSQNELPRVLIQGRNDELYDYYEKRVPF